MEKSGQGKDLSEQRALTTWRTQTKSPSSEGQNGEVRARKGFEQAKGTHHLENTDKESE